MTPLRRIQVIVTIAATLGLAAHASEPVMQAQDWTLVETSDANGTLCTISTSDKKGVLRVETYTLQISKGKNRPLSPVESSVSLDKNIRGSKSILVTLPSLAIEMAFPLLKSNGAETFWAIGRSTLSLISNLKSNDSLKVRGIGGSNGDVDLKFSGRGFSEVLAEMEKRCNGSAALASAEFEKLLIADVPLALDSTKIPSEVTSKLRSLYFQAYPLFQQKQETQAGLNAVLAKYQEFIKEQSAVRAELKQIQTVDLPTSRASLAAAQKQQVDARAEIARLTALIPSLQAKVQETQKIFNEADAILAPLRPEYNRLSQALRDSQLALSQAQSRLASIDNRLQTLANELSSMRSESSRLQQEISQERFQLSDAQSNLATAQSRRANFNTTFEREQRLRNNSDYNRLKDDRARLMVQAQQNEQRLHQVQGERDRIQGMLQQCRAVPAGAPPADCSQLEQALATADRQIAEIQTAVRQDQSRLNELSNRLIEIERSVSDQVQRDYDVLVARERECRQLVTRLEDELQRDQSRLSQLINSEIPNREREQSQLVGERPQVVARINQANSDVANNSNRLASFRAANDWDRKANAVEVAADNLNEAQDQLSSALSSKARAEQSLQDGISAESRLKARIASLEARATVLTSRDAELVKLLAPLPEERAPYDAKIEQLLKSISQLHDQYLSVLH